MKEEELQKLQIATNEDKNCGGFPNVKDFVIFYFRFFIAVLALISNFIVIAILTNISLGRWP